MGRDIGVDDAIQAGRKLTEKMRKPKEKALALPPAPCFPSDCFPPASGDFLEAVAESVQVPVDVPAVAALTVAGSAIGATRKFAFRRDYVASTTLYTCIVGPSGCGKSPAIGHVVAPLDIAQEFAQGEFTWYNIMYPQLVLDALQNNEPTPPYPRQHMVKHIIDDITMETISDRLRKNPRGFLCFKDELRGWAMDMNRYNNGNGDRSKWLSMYDGRAISVDRKNGEEKYIPNPALSLLGGIQPSVLEDIADKQNREDGLLPRFLFCHPQGLRIDNYYKDAPVPDALVEHWRCVVYRLIGLGFTHGTAPYVVPPASDLKPVYEAWFNRTSDELRHPDFPPACGPSYAKFRTMVLRVALILHELWQAETGKAMPELTAETMRRAVRVIEWAKGQVKTVYAALGDDKTARQLDLLMKWVGRKYKADDNGLISVNKRAVLMSKVAGVKSASEASALLSAAKDRGLGDFANDVFTVNTRGGE